MGTRLLAHESSFPDQMIPTVDIFIIIMMIKIDSDDYDVDFKPCLSFKFEFILSQANETFKEKSSNTALFENNLKSWKIILLECVGFLE